MTFSVPFSARLKKPPVSAVTPTSMSPETAAAAIGWAASKKRNVSVDALVAEIAALLRDVERRRGQRVQQAEGVAGARAAWRGGERAKQRQRDEKT